MRFEVLEVRKQLQALMEDIFRQGWRSENIFLFGFSQGCLIGSDLALNSNCRWAGVIGISGYFHFYPQWRMKLNSKVLGTPWLLTHGHRDEILPLETTRFGVQKLKSAGFDVQWIEMDKRHVFLESEYPKIRSWVKNQLKCLPGEFQPNPAVSNTNQVSPEAVAFVQNIAKSQPLAVPENQRPTDQ